ncbi:Hypothetical protein D9617_1g083200 [Elsinoe fawcettii]|nr:Hypothetical protein D9617_1g083200 [Elsinoe fawcettii]
MTTTIAQTEVVQQPKTDSLSPDPKFHATRKFRFDFQWSNFKTRIHDEASLEGQPMYIADFKLWAWRPKVFLKSGDGNTVIGAGVLPNFTISPTLTIHGRDIKIEAARKLKTHYVYPSQTILSSGHPQTMTWITTNTAKWWHFNLLDENQQPIARYSVNFWALKEFAYLEIMGDYAHNEKAVEEILATAFTVYSCILYRSNNIFNLLGSAFHKKPKAKEITDDNMRTAAKDDFELSQQATTSGTDAPPPAYERPGKASPDVKS